MKIRLIFKRRILILTSLLALLALSIICFGMEVNFTYRLKKVISLSPGSLLFDLQPDTEVNIGITYNITSNLTDLDKQKVDDTEENTRKSTNNSRNIEEIQRNHTENVKNLLPAVPDVSKDDLIPEISDNVRSLFLELPQIDYKYNVAVLTPVRNVAEHLDNFASLIQRLTYPHGLMSVFLGEDSSEDDTFNKAMKVIAELKSGGFNEGAVFQFNISGGIGGSWKDKHAHSKQEVRRSHMAKVRNLLVKSALSTREFDYVLWIDCDLKSFPVDLVEQLLFAKSDVAVATCVYHDGKAKRNYDKNSWRETKLSTDYEAGVKEDFLIVEGYKDSRRIMLPDLKAEGRFVPLDGVGGCALLIKAKCFQEGLVFPEVIYQHHIETEGLAKLALARNYTVVGLPFLEVLHS